MPDIAKTIRHAAAIAAALLVVVVVAGAGILAWYDGERLSDLVTGHLRDRYGIVLEIEQLERTYEWRPLITIRHLKVSNAAAYGADAGRRRRCQFPDPSLDLAL